VEATTEEEILVAINDAGRGTRRRLAWQARWVLTRGLLDLRRGSKRTEDAEGDEILVPSGGGRGEGAGSAAMGGEKPRMEGFSIDETRRQGE